MKSILLLCILWLFGSPPEWGAWIEIRARIKECVLNRRRPPSGGRGLK